MSAMNINNPLVQAAIIVVAFILGFVVLVLLLGFTIGLVLTLLVAGLIGWLADLLVPGKLPYGQAGAVVAGVVGAVIASLIPAISDVGPELFDIRVVPAFVGTLIVVALVQFYSFGSHR